MRIKGSKGDYFHGRLDSIPARDSGGKTQIRTSVTDITHAKAAEKEIEESLEEKKALLNEIHHRVKNNMQAISSLLELQANYIRDRKALEVFQACQGQIKSMTLVHEQLYRFKDLAKIEFRHYIETLAAGLFKSYGIDANKIEAKVNAEAVCLEIVHAIPCGLILNELITNSLKYAFPGDRKGKITISMREIPEFGVELVVSDDGVGFPQDMDFSNSKTFGLHLVNNFVRQIQGEMKINGKNGTEFRITFPACKKK